MKHSTLKIFLISFIGFIIVGILSSWFTSDMNVVYGYYNAIILSVLYLSGVVGYFGFLILDELKRVNNSKDIDNINFSQEDNKKTIFFQTERLSVRTLSAEDITSFCKMQNNENVMKYIIGKPKPIEESIDELGKILDSYNNINPNFLIMAVIDNNLNQFIGTCAIVKNSDSQHELGYRLMEKYWQNGYGTEILNSLISFALDELSLKLITASAYKNNIPSVKILDNSQMEFIEEYEEPETGDLIRNYKISKY